MIDWHKPGSQTAFDRAFADYVRSELAKRAWRSADAVVTHAELAEAATKDGEYAEAAAHLRALAAHSLVLCMVATAQAAVGKGEACAT